MLEFKVPSRDLRFVLHELLAVDAHYQALPGGEEAGGELLDAIVEEAARFGENALFPLYAGGDQEGCRLEAGTVRTPSGFKEAYQAYVEGGWPAISQPAEYGGQGLPDSLGILVSEIVATANWAWAMYPGLCHGAMYTLERHGSDPQKSLYLPPLISGRWMATMCLTEAHCGTDLGLLKTRAEPQPDGSYRITGTKIFISSGDHDLAENIVHIVLARLPDAPRGTRGISLFIVPKFLPDSEGQPGEANSLSCGGLEEKMGIHGNATCVLNFDGATGWLLGAPNRGLACMFTFMNNARLGTALQGLAAAELSYQGAARYALERLQMRSLSGPKAPDKEADPIIVHPDVRRMLLTQRAFAEGGRMLIHYAAHWLDLANRHPDADRRRQAHLLLGFLTPIAKAFVTETGFEAANLGIQVYGGHGYIRENGMEQILRDCRIGMLYEGTTGIQALDLLGRKLLLKQGRPLEAFAAIVEGFCRDNPRLSHGAALAAVMEEWQQLTRELQVKALADPEEVGAAAVDYLMYSGYCVQAYLWARASGVALAALAEGTEERAFYRAKVQCARFFFERLLPRTRTLAATIRAGSDGLMTMSEEAFVR